jgi:hypothetical protein
MPGVAGVMAGFPATTYDFPYAGLLRPVSLYTVPATEHIDDVTVTTTIEGTDGVVHVTVSTAGDHTGAGRSRVGDVEADLPFRGGTAQVRACRGSGASRFRPVRIAIA